VKPNKTLTLESLESRLAPASFFVSGTALTVKDTAGNDAQNLANETAAQTVTGATKAVLLNAGDALVFDANDNRVRDPQERVLVSVAAGKAIVFLSDGFGPTAGAFDENEISGLAVSSGFTGTINTDVNGSITTTLDAAGQFTQTTLLNNSIAGLTIAGRVFGDLVAGKNISKVRIGSGLFTPAPDQSVGHIFTGTSGDQDSVRYASLGNPFTLSFTQPAGANGGNIRNVRLANSATSIEAGDGGAVASGSGNGGAGGSVVGLAVASALEGFSLTTGTGGATVQGKGGSGGNLSQSSITFQNNRSVPGSFLLGSGGDSTAGSGGNGGSVVSTTINMVGDGSNLTVAAGLGGQASGKNTVAGRGGQIAGSTIRLMGGLGQVRNNSLVGGVLNISGGTGGAGVGTPGGAGGGIVNSRIEALDTADSIPVFLISGGFGGAGSTDRGGPGGAISGTSVLVNETIGIDVNGSRVGQASVSGGNGGSGVTRGGDGGAFNGNDVRFLGLVDLQSGKKLDIVAGEAGSISATGVGGHGGNFRSIPVNGVVRKNTIVLNDVADDVLIRAGLGGNQTTASSPGSGGAGGSLSGLNFELIGDAPNVTISAGTGGNAGIASGAIGNGGIGGGISDVTAIAHGTIANQFAIAGGFGGKAGATQGIGGAGGNATGITARVNAAATVGLVAGGAAISKDANGSAGGNLSSVVVENTGLIGSNLVLEQGFGGAVSGTGAAGPGGGISHVTINNLGGVNNQILVGVNTVPPGTGSGNGGNAGSTSFITINSHAHYGQIEVNGTAPRPAGAASTNANGGNSGSVSNVTINDFDSDGTGAVAMISRAGGAGVGSGKGGNSGSISNVSLFGPLTNFFVQTTNGGASDSGQGGSSGSISNVHGVVGTLIVETGDGGSAIGATGKGGIGGSVNGVNITSVNSFVRWILAGNGGNGGLLGGNGGSIANVHVAGDIGDFASAFSLVNPNVALGMGGLIAGQAGTGGVAVNGSISQVSATRIAAIFAGRPAPNNITAANAVQSLTLISAQVIGADVNHNELFDFTDAGPAGFNLGDGDTAIDGFVLVKHASNLAALPVAALEGISLGV
jgi:hypothetical protein